MRESDLLQYIYRASGKPEGVVIPPGDDMGAIRLGNSTLLVTVDQVADGVHVDLKTMPLAKVGRKCITRNLSDVAAMAAKPIAAVAAVCLPRDFGEANAKALFDAMRTTAERYSCPLIGGDISMWDAPMIASVTIFAEPAGIEPVLRSTAKPGDAIYVTGQLGNSLASGHHLDFEPRLAAACALASNPATRPTAMMDLSDGLAMDLPRMAAHAEVEAVKLPIRQGTPEPMWRHAVGDGEDYELLFTAAPEARIPAEVAGVPITRIGTVRDSGGLIVRLPDGAASPLTGGWEHHT